MIERIGSQHNLYTPRQAENVSSIEKNLDSKSDPQL